MRNKKTWQEIKDELFEKYQLAPEAVDHLKRYQLAYPFAKAIFECTEPGSMEDFIAEGGHIFYLADPSEIKKQSGENEFVICDRAYTIFKIVLLGYVNAGDLYFYLTFSIKLPISN